MYTRVKKLFSFLLQGMRTKETQEDLRDGLLEKRRDFKLALVLMQLLFRMDYFTDTKRKDREKERRTCAQHRKSSHPETRCPGE